MGSVECATKRIGYPDQGLIQKIHQMPFCTLVLSLWNPTLPCASSFAPLPPAPVHTLIHTLTCCTPSSLMELRESLKIPNNVTNKIRVFLDELSTSDHVSQAL